jgi:hypothetical protein
MRFFVSRHLSAQQDNTVCILITTDAPANAAELRSMLADEFGPWMLLGVREYPQQQFLNSFSEHIPQSILKAIALQPSVLLYKAATHIKKELL